MAEVQVLGCGDMNFLFYITHQASYPIDA